MQQGDVEVGKMAWGFPPVVVYCMYEMPLALMIFKKINKCILPSLEFVSR